MNFDEYQQLAMRTAPKEVPRNLAMGALGIAGEAGEVADYLKKVLYHGHPISSERLVKELGDVLWYVAYLADSIGVPLETLAIANIEKLRARYPDGFSSAASIGRKEIDS